MKANLLLSMILPVLVLGSVSSHQGPKRARTLDDYKPSTLKDLAATNSDIESGVEKNQKYVVIGNFVPSKVRVTYSGSARPLLQIKKDVIADWARRYAGNPGFYTTPYQQELLFNEEGKEYWLAVKKELVPKFGPEVKKGDAVDLYLIRLGMIKADPGWEPVLLVESFAKSEVKTTAKQ